MSRQIQIRSSAALLTIALHAILMSPLMLGMQARKSHSAAPGGAPASAQQVRLDQITSTLMLLNDHDVTAPDNSVDAAALLAAVTQQTSAIAMDFSKPGELPQLEVNGTEDGIEVATPSATIVGDQAERTMMFVQYLSQVTSRIQRAWLLPRKMLATHFRCRVQIRHDAAGVVQAVTLQRCDEDAATQMSLVKAVQNASPLPMLVSDTPLDEVTLDFEAVAGSADTRMTSVMPSANDL
jgi:membrane protein involved in colicin uptake